MKNRLSCSVLAISNRSDCVCADCDPVWNAIQAEALQQSQKEPLLHAWLERCVLRHARIEAALGHLLGEKLFSEVPEAFQNVFQEAIADEPSIRDAILEDLQTIRRHDPATLSYLNPFLHFKGFLAVEAHRIAHWLWKQGRTMLAQHIQSHVSQRFGVDIHPAARLGQGVFIDHATGVVIGQTAVVGDGVVMLHGVTLGSNGKENGDRHPKVGAGVFIGAGAELLGNIRIGEGARIGAGSVVLSDVPAETTVVGVPARPVGRSRPASPDRFREPSFARPAERPFVASATVS